MKRLSCPGIHLMAILTVLALLVTGCTASKTSYSGWLKDYKGFAQDPEYKDAMAYSQADAELKKYTKFIQLLSEYKNNPTGRAKIKLINESYRLLSLGLCGHLSVG